jgi:hypothetical protein
MIQPNQNQELFFPVAVIPAKAGIQSFFWIPGRGSVARSDDPTPETVKLQECPGRACRLTMPGFATDGSVQFIDIDIGVFSFR